MCIRDRVYSTNPDFNYDMDDDQEQVTLDKSKQNLRVSLDRKNRGGKVVTPVSYTHLDVYKRQQ